MVLNSYFQQGARSEQNLVQSLINEQLKMYGVEVHYLPRKYVSENTVIKEVVRSKFDDAYPLEAYVNTYDGYGENPVMLSKFGIQATNEITLTISRERYEDYITPLIKNESDIKLATRPKEGDLIYFPLGDRLFEIKYVEHEKPFYQLQKNYIYELRCELFRYEDEIIDTGVDAIDDELVGDDTDGTTDEGLTSILGPSMTFTMIGTASTAWAYTGIVTTGGIYKVAITNRGGGYIYAPNVGFGSAPTVGVTSSYAITGIGSVGTMLDIQACNKNVATNQKSVQQIDIVNPGYGYTMNPGVAVTAVASGPGSGFAGTAFVADGTLGVVTVTNAGSGFASDRVNVTFNTPLSFTNTGVGTTATGVAIINSGGTVDAVRYTNAGSGYTTGDLPISVTIADPESSGSGDYIFNETVTGGTSSATARVRTWNSTTSVLEVASVVGTFVVGETLTGGTSGATHDLRTMDKDPLDDGFADNTQIETSADAILDFTEANPFGTP
jgi:hypothetical protein